MSTIYHTPIAYNSIADDDTFNAPLSQLDTHLDDAMSFGVNNNAELAAARSPYVSLAARLAAITFGYVGGNIATLTNGAASAGQQVVTVDSTTGFLAGAYVAYELVGGTVEYNTVDTIDSPTQLTLDTNIGTGGIADNSYIGMISVSEYQAANAIPHDDPLTLPQAMAYANSDKFHVGAYGAWPGASQSVNTAGINAAIAAAKAAGGGTVQLRLGTYAYDGSLDLCETANIKLAGASGHFGTVLECHNADGACIEVIGSKQITLEDFKLVGHGSDTPAVGIWTGRTDPSVYAAGEDTSQIVGNRLHIYGAFTKTLIYNTGCESNHWTNCYLYATNAACLAGVMTSYQNTLGLTPEHTTLTDPPIVGTISVIDKCFITCDVAATSYSPIYTVYDETPAIYNSYLACWGAPAVYLKGGVPGSSVIIRDTGVEGTPTYLIYGDVWDGNPGGYSVTTSFRLDLYRFGGSAATSGYSIYLEDDSLLQSSEIRQCNFADDVRFYNIAEALIDRLAWYSSSVNPALVVAGYAVNSYIRVGYNDTLTLSGNLVNVTVDYDSGADAPGTGYLLLAGNKGLAIGGAPGAAQQAVTRLVRTAASASPWAPGTLADGAAASTYVLVTDVLADGTWFCQASYPGTGGATANIVLSAWAGNGAVVVSILNKTGGDITPSGTLYVVAQKIVET